MTSPNARVPAWKKLGLKLGGDALNGQNGDQENRELQNSHNEAVETFAPVNGFAEPDFTQGAKRKHQDTQAEAHHETNKKRRKEQEQQDSGPFDTQARVSATEDVPAPNSVSRMAIKDQPQPKGDPNYRKKKAKSTQNREEDASNSLPPSKDLHKGTVTKRKKLKASDKPSHLLQEESGDTLLASTENHDVTPPSLSTPQKSSASGSKLRKTSHSKSPLPTDRRKSVTFTPDTKKADGNSASNLFKQWVAEQKSAGGDFTASEFQQFTPPPSKHIANGLPAAPSSTPKDDKKQKSKSDKKAVSSATAVAQEHPSGERSSDKSVSATESTTKGKSKKKDPSVYLAYLSQYFNDRASWKFNKAKQNDVLDNALNIFRIPDDHSEALLEYIKGLQGAAVIQRLKERCHSVIEELDEADKKEPTSMDDNSARKLAAEEALEERLAKENKRRRTDADVETITSHPYPEGFIRRLKRRRADALLSALNMAAPAAPVPIAGTIRTSQADEEPVSAPLQRNPRKRKSRTEISSDESSSESSSSESDDDSSSEDEASSAGDDLESSDSSGSASSSGSDDDSEDPDEDDDSSSSDSD